MEEGIFVSGLSEDWEIQDPGQAQRAKDLAVNIWIAHTTGLLTQNQFTYPYINETKQKNHSIRLSTFLPSKSMLFAYHTAAL